MIKGDDSSTRGSEVEYGSTKSCCLSQAISQREQLASTVDDAVVNDATGGKINVVPEGCHNRRVTDTGGESSRATVTSPRVERHLPI